MKEEKAEVPPITFPGVREPSVSQDSEVFIQSVGKLEAFIHDLSPDIPVFRLRLFL